ARFPTAQLEPHQLQRRASSGSGYRTKTSRLSHPRLCDNRQVCLIGAPVKWGSRGPTPLVKGRWPKARGDREGEYGHKVPILSSPLGGFLASFWPPKKKLAPQGETPNETKQ